MTRKHLLTAAIATAVVTPGAQALEFTAQQGLSLVDNTTFNLYGTVEPKVISEKNGAGDTSTELDDEDSTLGFGFETRLSNTVTAYGQLELEYESDDTTFTALRATFSQGRTEFYGSAQRVSPDNETAVKERDELTVGVSHQLYEPLGKSRSVRQGERRRRQRYGRRHLQLLRGSGALSGCQGTASWQLATPAFCHKTVIELS